MSIFTDDSEVISVGEKWLTIVSYCYFVYAWWMENSNGVVMNGQIVHNGWIDSGRPAPAF